MTRNLKVLGLSLVAVFAISAVTASLASAQQGTLTSSGPVTLTGVGTSFSLTFESEAISCVISNYSGHKYNVTPHAFIPVPATTATVIPTYINCTNRGLPTTITMNGCDYVMHIGATTGFGGQYNVTTDIVCPAGKVIEAHVYISGKHTTTVCTVKIGAQTGLSSGTLENFVGERIRLIGSVTGISASKEGICGSKSTTAASMDIDVQFDGVNESNEFTTVSVTHP